MVWLTGFTSRCWGWSRRRIISDSTDRGGGLNKWGESGQRWLLSETRGVHYKSPTGWRRLLTFIQDQMVLRNCCIMMATSPSVYLIVFQRMSIPLGRMFQNGRRFSWMWMPVPTWTFHVKSTSHPLKVNYFFVSSSKLVLGYAWSDVELWFSRMRGTKAGNWVFRMKQRCNHGQVRPLAFRTL